MNIKKMFVGLALIITIFLSYTTLHPMKTKYQLEKNEYTLKIYNISKNNKWSSFSEKKNGNFFIHPGEAKPVKAEFTFHQDSNFFFDFYIAKASTSGNIEFTVKKNGEEIEKLIVTTKKQRSLVVPVHKDDKIEIIADKHGFLGQDWGHINIQVQETNLLFKHLIIPFLWAILFIFILGKNHEYIAINSYLIFLLILFSEKISFGPITFQAIFAYTLLVFSMLFIFIYLYQELYRLKKFKVAALFSYITATAVYLIPLVFIIYALNFDTKITKDILYAVFQTNNSEAFEYVSDFISLKYIILFLFVTSLVGYLLYRQEQKEVEKIEKSLLLFMIIIFISITLLEFSNLRLPNFVINNFEKYHYELAKFKKVQEKRKAGGVQFSASKVEQGETYIVVIGESLNKKHMGVYGYLRDTTPNLSKLDKMGQLIIYQNAYSNHTQTAQVLSLALTEANQYNKKFYYDSLSIIDILKKSNIKSYWLTNQELYGDNDNVISVIGTSADQIIAMNKSIGKNTGEPKYDGTLIDEVKKVLETKSKKNRVLFVHLIGNHGSYTSRYPHNEYSVYKGSLKKGNFGEKASKVKYLNNYDNSVVYNDYVVSSILKELQKQKGVKAFIYMSDHSEDVINKLGHSSAKFTFNMTQIPMITWFSEEYKKRYPDKYNNLLHRTDILFSNDMLYDTLVGLFDIETDKYNSQYDFTSNNYKLNSKDALTLHGKIKYTDKSNHIYWQQINTKYLVDTNQSSRIFPHRVDSIGKLKDVWNDGFRSFELDVRFGDDNTIYFLVEQNKRQGDVKLDDFISSIDYTKIERIWLDFKNLNVDNLNEALKYLEYLDNKYHIKNKFIVESGMTDEFFNHFRKEGWHTSYHLPTGKIVKLLNSKSNAEMKKLAESISTQAHSQNLSGVSFDNKLYLFVKEYLEPLLNKDIVYHTWYAPELYDVNFKEKLGKNKLYQDERVKTLLAPYDSEFHL